VCHDDSRTSRLPPERQCMVIFTSASAEMRTLRVERVASANKAHKVTRPRAARRVTHSARSAHMHAWRSVSKGTHCLKYRGSLRHGFRESTCRCAASS
jgi:hypothetical protein